MSELREKPLKAPREVRFFRPTFVIQADPSGLSVSVHAETPLRSLYPRPASSVDVLVTAP